MNMVQTIFLRLSAYSPLHTTAFACTGPSAPTAPLPSLLQSISEIGGSFEKRPALFWPAFTVDLAGDDAAAAAAAVSLLSAMSCRALLTLVRSRFTLSAGVFDFLKPIGFWFASPISPFIISIF
jgi:hypothetical protein